MNQEKTFLFSHAHLRIVNDLLDEAANEVKKAKRETLPDSQLAIRQAAEKVWGYIASELNQRLRAHGLRVEEGGEASKDRRMWLTNLDGKLGKDFTSRYDEYADLHGSCFYESRCPTPQRIEEMIEKARPFIEEVENALGKGRPKKGEAP